MQFKTNAKCAGCSSAIINSLTSLAPASDWSMDLSSPDKVLRYSGNSDIEAEKVIEAVQEVGFQIELITD